MTVQRTTRSDDKGSSRRLLPLLALSAWGYVMVLVSFTFLFIGYTIDQRFDTQPTFMLGLFVLAVFLSLARLYWEVWNKRDID